MRKILVLCFLLMASTAFAALTPGNIPKTKTGGTSPSLENSIVSETTGAISVSGTISATNLSGTNTGDQTNITGNAATATALASDPTACSAGQYVSDIAAGGTLTCGTPTDTDTNTNASTICSGTTTYLDGEGNCDDISSVYQGADTDLTTWAGITPGTGVGTFLATPSSANFTSALTDEDGTGDCDSGKVCIGGHTHSTYLTGNQSITLSGDASGSGTTAITVTVADDSHAHTSTSLPATTSYLGSTIGKEELTSEDFGGFTCNGTSCSVDSDGTWTAHGSYPAACSAGEYVTAIGDTLTCSAPSGSGDVTGVGDCSSGACLDGTSDGGTYIKLYDGDSNYLQLGTAGLSGDATINFGTMTTTKWCKYTASGTVITCDVDPVTDTNTTYTAGDGLTLTGTDIDFDGGDSPGGELGGTWASPTIDDSVTVTGWVLGNSTATTLNKLTLTAPATGSTLTIIDGKTLTVTNTVDLAATVTDEHICNYEGTGTQINCDIALDASGSCAAGSICSGGHTHPTTEVSGVNAGTDLTADLEEETHAAEHAVGAADTVFPADPNADRVLAWDDDPGALVWSEAGAGNVVDTLAATLGSGADANDVDTTSWGKMEGFDSGLYLDWDADGVIDLTSDGTLELHSADWDISTTGVATGMGDITSDGTITAGVGFDCTGAADCDFGSADILDLTFTEADSTLIIDGGITVSTGDKIQIGTTQWNSGDGIDGEVIANDTIDDDSIDFADIEDDLESLLDIDGEVSSTGMGTTVLDETGISLTSITIGSLLGVDSIDATGAVDMDYGSADITDHTFVADGGTVIIDGNINSSTLTASEIVITDASKNLVSAAVATYPSLTELSYVKGLASAIQTQINGKQATVTEGSLSDSVIVSADIKDATIAGGDLASNIAVTSTGAQDYGGAASFEIPNGATVSDPAAAGQVAIDTTTGQFLYHDGTAQRVMVYNQRRCFGWFDPADADDDIEVWIFKEAATVTNISCRVSGGTSIAVTGGDGTNAFEAITCDADGAADDGSITNATFTAGEVLELDLGAPSGTVPSFTYCVDYTITAD